jgi:hypothetical protein
MSVRPFCFKTRISKKSKKDNLNREDAKGAKKAKNQTGFFMAYFICLSESWPSSRLRGETGDGI